MEFLKGIYFLNLGFGSKYGSEEKILQRLFVINIILLCGSFLYVIFDFVNDFLLNGGYKQGDLPVLLLFASSLFSLILYKRGFFFADKLLTVYAPQIFVFGCAYFDMVHGEYFLWLPLVLLGFSVFPVLIFDLKKEKGWLIAAVVFNLLYMVFYDRILFLKADPQYLETYAVLSANAAFYKSVQIVLYIFLMILLYFVIRVNYHQQLLCERINKSLSRERDRLDDLNAEILAQRNAMNKAASILVTDVNGSIQSANKNFCEITGYSLRELIGKNPRIFKSGYHSDEFFADMWKTIKSGEIWSGEIKNKRKDNSYYWLDTTIAPLYDKNGGQTGYLAMRFDCTKRKLFEEELMKLNKEKEHILYAIAHDLKNPLTNLLTILRLMKMNALDENQKEDSYKLIINDCKYSLKLINQLLEVGRLESLKGEMHKKSVNIKKLIQNSLDQFNDIIREKNLHVKVKYSKFINHVHVDVNKFENALNNLIFNAIKFTPDGGEIMITAEKNADHTEIKIIDNGIGISEKLLPYIFDKFSKASRPGTNGEKSNGLGLWIVKRIVELHGGEIKVFSKENAGTKIELSLP